MWTNVIKRERVGGVWIFNLTIAGTGKDGELSYQASPCIKVTTVTLFSMQMKWTFTLGVTLAVIYRALYRSNVSEGPWHGYREQNLGPLQDQFMLLTPEPSLPLQSMYLCSNCLKHMLFLSHGLSVRFGSLCSRATCMMKPFLYHVTVHEFPSLL